MVQYATIFDRIISDHRITSFAVGIFAISVPYSGCHCQCWHYTDLYRVQFCDRAFGWKDDAA